MALFGMEHYEVILLSWLVAAAALCTVTAITFSLVFGVFAPKHAAARRQVMAAQPGRARRAEATIGAPVGAV